MAQIDITRLTLGQIEDMEEISGITYDQWAKRKIKFAIAALVVLGGHEIETVRAMDTAKMQEALDAIET